MKVSVAESKLKPPRLSGKSVQDVDRLAIRVRSTEAITVRAAASVRLPRTRGALGSRAARAKIGANHTVTLHFKFAAGRLRKIEAALAGGRRIKAKVTVTARNAAGLTARASKTIRLKP